MKKLYLLTLAVLAGQPAPANEHTPPATDQRTVVLGQSGTEAPNPAPEEKAKKDAQALFEKSLRQRCRRIRGRFRNTRERSDQRESGNLGRFLWGLRHNDRPSSRYSRSVRLQFTTCATCKRWRPMEFTLDAGLAVSGLKLPKAEKGAEEDAMFLVNADACSQVADMVEGVGLA